MKFIALLFAAVSMTSFSAVSFAECTVFDNQAVAHADLDNLLKEADNRIKSLVLKVDEDSSKIDIESKNLATSFAELHIFIKGKDLRRNKQAILQNQDGAEIQSKKVEDALKILDDLMVSDRKELDEAHCSVESLYQYFAKKVTGEKDPQVLRALTTSRNQLEGKSKTFKKILADFDKFFNQLKNYTDTIKTSSDHLLEFANSVVAYENQTCTQKKHESCPMPSGDVEALLTKQRTLIKKNKEFLKSKIELIKQSQNWKLNDEQQ